MQFLYIYLRVVFNRNVIFVLFLTLFTFYTKIKNNKFTHATVIDPVLYCQLPTHHKLKFNFTFFRANTIFIYLFLLHLCYFYIIFDFSYVFYHNKNN